MPETDAITVIPLETPTLGDRSYLVHDGEVAFVVDPQRDIDRVLALLDEQRLRLTHVFESHIHNDYVTGGFALARRAGAAYLVNADGRGVLRAGPGARRRRPRDRAADAGHRGRHAGSHVHPPVLRARRRQHRGADGGLLRRLAAVRGDRPAGPPRPPAHRRPRAGAARLGPQAGRDAAGRRGGVPHPRVRVLLLRDAIRGGQLDNRPGEGCQPGAHPGRGDVRPRAAGRPERLPRLLRAHGSRQLGGPVRAGPVPARHGRPGRRSGAASRPASGWWTCATGPCSPPGTCPAR